MHYLPWIYYEVKNLWSRQLQPLRMHYFVWSEGTPVDLFEDMRARVILDISIFQDIFIARDARHSRAD
ncbi:hypothetical protein EUGRSUZ_A01548 [Eucalyptus grandis]|uniref:Uncharacterized protein n=2 Tax=Eucalyptus grandis TaxID=71139 RepID=A0ACC3M326_EUCGR|nr:hypothetical protein EUGRSUZ_A01548 [Eucalyptus grandis]